MALTSRGDYQLKLKAKRKAQESTNPIEKLRLQCLARGGSGILGLGRSENFLIVFGFSEAILVVTIIRLVMFFCF